MKFAQADFRLFVFLVLVVFFVRCCGGAFNPPRNAASKRRCASFFSYKSDGALDMESFTEQTRDLCMRIGIALTRWQNVEEQHYHLFLLMLGVKEGPVPSVVYFSVESFDSRRKMIGRMADCFLSTKELNTEWGTLNKRLKDANDARNSMAHYGIYINAYERTVGDSIELIIDPPTIQPSLYNKVSELLGRTKDPKHSLDADKIDSWIIEFGELAEAVAKFKTAISLAPARPVPLPTPPPPTPKVSPPPRLNKRQQNTDPSC